MALGSESFPPPNPCAFAFNWIGLVTNTDGSIEQMKAKRERGFYMHPELFDAGPDKPVAAARHPGMKLTLKNAQYQNPIN
jgi:hypothetical protein